LPDAKVLSSESIREFFSDLLRRAIENQRAQVQPTTLLYVTNLLHEYLSSEALYVQAGGDGSAGDGRSADARSTKGGSWQQKPLAFLLKEALEEQGPARVQMLRRLGDTSLFVSGFFPDSLSRRSSLVDVDYYIAMGGRAYDAVGSIAARHASRDLWDELSSRFRLLVDLLNEVSERTLASTDTGVVRLYERWLKTGSDRISGVLAQRGIPTRKGFVQ
jgi:hypothetical protein